MVNVFRPADGLVFALYVEGVRCSFEQVSIVISDSGPPFLQGQVPATYTGVETVAYPSHIEEELADKKEKLQFIQNQLAVLQQQAISDAENLTLALKIREVEKAVAALNTEIKKLEATPKIVINKQLNWRDLPENTKVHVLFKDLNWNDTGRFVGYFEGLIVSPGITRTSNSRGFQFQAVHITDALSTLILGLMDPASFTNELTNNTNLLDGVPSVFVSSGTVVEKFTPKELAKYAGVPEAELDVYNFARFSLKYFIDTLKASPIKNSFDVTTASTFDFTKRVYHPSTDPATGLENTDAPKLKWSNLYTNIMNYTAMNVLPKQGSRLNYLQMLNSVLPLFLHEAMINPAPTSYYSTVVIKPNNVFNPVPVCNLLMPAVGTNVNFMENYKTKPTRLTLSMDPPNGLPPEKIGLVRYYRNIAPGILAAKYDEFLSATTTEAKQAVDFLTPEEKRRSIVDCTEQLPGFLTGLLEMIAKTDADGNVITNPDGSISGGGTGYSASSSTDTTLDTTRSLDANSAAIDNKLFYHNTLAKLEGKSNTTQFKSDFKYIPERVILADSKDMSKLLTQKINYEIKQGVLIKKLGRAYHVFEEPSGSIPYAIKINDTLATLTPLNTQEIFQIRGNNEGEETSLSLTYLKSESSTLTAHIQNMLPHISGGFHKSVVIVTDRNPKSEEVLMKVLACLSELCGINIDTKENKGNVRTLSDFYGNSFHTFNRDKELKSIVTKSKDTLIALKKQKDPGVVIATSAPGTSESYNPKVLQGLIINEGAGSDESSAKISHAIIGASNYTFGKSQFDVGQRADAWLAVGISKTDIDRLIKIGNGVRSAGSRKVETASDKEFISSLEGILRKNINAVRSMDNKQKGSLVKKAIETIRKYFSSETFTSPSVIAHFVDILNQLGPNSISNDSNRLTRMKGSDGKISPNGVLNWRIQNSNLDADMRRRHNNIENLFKSEQGLSLSADQLIQYAYKDATSLGVISAGVEQALVKNSVIASETSVASNATAEETSVVFPDGTSVNIKQIYDNYSQPLCEFFFYKARYSGNSTSMPIAMSPYLIPGYSVLILDNSETSMHLTGYLRRVTQIIDGGGKSLTSVPEIGYMRRADDLGMSKDLKLTAVPVTGSDGVEKYPDTLAESLKDRVPFFGGEYASEHIGVTYDKTIGCSPLTEGDDFSDFLNISDIQTVYEITRRKIQYCKITDLPTPEAQSYYDGLYTQNPSTIAFKWNKGSFPDRIHIINTSAIVNGITTETLLLDTDADGAYKYVIDDKIFNEEVQQMVQYHTALTQSKGALAG